VRCTTSAPNSIFSDSTGIPNRSHRGASSEREEAKQANLTENGDLSESRVEGTITKAEGGLIMERTTVTAPDAGKPVGPYSQAVVAGGWIFVSAEKGVDPATGKIVEGGVPAETEQTLTNIRTILAAAEASLGDVVRCVVYLTDISQFPAMNEVYARFFPERPPARTTVGVSELPLGLNVMIEATAWKEAGR
jgi:2-iminobutanoate/2-iminopropanoate deaminase